MHKIIFSVGNTKKMTEKLAHDYCPTPTYHLCFFWYKVVFIFNIHICTSIIYMVKRHHSEISTMRISKQHANSQCILNHLPRSLIFMHCKSCYLVDWSEIILGSTFVVAIVILDKFIVLNDFCCIKTSFVYTICSIIQGKHMMVVCTNEFKWWV